MPPLDELLDSARVVALPLNTRFRGLEVREALLLRGPEGWTEFSPFAEYEDAEAAAWLAAALDFGWQPLPSADSIPDRVGVNATLPAVTVDRVPAVLDRFPGCRTVKVKVAEAGQDLADDVARVRAVRRHLGHDVAIRVDANGGWSVDEAASALTELAEFGLQYAEQPCMTVPQLAELRGRLNSVGVTVPIAADESVRKAVDPLAVARAGAADLLVIKAQPLGGVRRALDIIAEAGLPVVVSSALDTSVGLSMGAALAARIPGLAYDCGLGTAALLAADVTGSPLVPVDGSIPTARVEVDETLLKTHRAPADRERWWLNRLARTHALLTPRA